MRRYPNKARAPKVPFWRSSRLWSRARRPLHPASLAKWRREHPEEAAAVDARRAA